MFKHIDIGTHNKSFKSGKLLTGIRRCIFSARFRIILMMSVLAVISVISVVLALKYSYIESLINKRKEYISNEAVLMSAEFTDYSDLSDARKGGMYENLMNYSALNQMRIRVVDRKYMVSLDTYAVDNGKTIISSKVIDVYESSKAAADYNHKSGSIEAVSPVYNSEGTVIAVLVVNFDVSDIRVLVGDAFDGIYVVLFVVITFIIVSSIVISYFYMRHYNKALKIVEAVDVGYTDKRIEIKGSTELRSFAAHFNSIMDKNNELDSSRSEFVSNVSHELKTPITSVRGYAELLSQDFVKDEATRKDFLGRILKETEHMTSLIDDILMISRLESKDAEVTLSKVNLKSVMDEVLESLTPQAASCKVEISGSCGNVILQASLQQMRELLSNLISNGIKYNHPGGHVWTKIWQEPEAVYIEVKDDGVGIDPEDQKRVFERFFRVDKGRSRKMGGTGLGLSIVKHITAYYGGSVRLTSAPGAGSTFFVEIPMSGINKM